MELELAAQNRRMRKAEKGHGYGNRGRGRVVLNGNWRTMYVVQWGSSGRVHEV